TDMQVAVRLGREAGDHPAAEAPAGVVLQDDVPDEVRGLLAGLFAHPDECNACATRFLPCRRPPARWSAAGRSAARVVGDREAERPGGGLVVEVVPGALELRRGDQEPQDGGLVRRVLALLGPVGGDQTLDRGERAL